MIELSTVNYIFGSPGTGKTTVLAMLSKQLRKRGYTCFSNVEIEGCYLYNDLDVGKYSFKSPTKKQCVFCDEAGIIYNNRSAFQKNGIMSDEDRVYYWKRVRHDCEEGGKNIFVMISQSWNDIDKKIRDLSTSYFHLKKFGPLTVIRPIYKKCDIDDQTHEPTDYFTIDFFWNYKFCWRPAYYKMFDSFEMKHLPNWLAEHPDAEPYHSPKYNNRRKFWKEKSLTVESSEDAKLNLENDIQESGSKSIRNEPSSSYLSNW